MARPPGRTRNEPAHPATSAPLPARAFLPAVMQVVLTPSLWPVALHQLAATTPPRWWHHAPFAPLPDQAYLRFRTETAYGPDARPGRDDLVAYLRWCKGRPR
jgi:hypothetical protein